MNFPPNTMSNTIDKYIIITFSIVTNSYPCHLYIFVTENYSSKFTIMTFRAPALKSPAENGIPKKSLDALLPFMVEMMFPENCLLAEWKILLSKVRKGAKKEYKNIRGVNLFAISLMYLAR